MSERPFVDYYELLQVSPTADHETIERVYRLLAKRYHPDNSSTGSTDRFTAVRQAFEILSGPESRAQYDVKFEEEKGVQWRIFDQESAGSGHEQDQRIFHGVLSLLYVARRRDPKEGGLGVIHIERMLGTPREHLDFPLWYLKRRGWIEVLSGGQLAITVDGVDKLGSRELSLPNDRLLSESAMPDPHVQTGDPIPALRGGSSKSLTH